MVYYQSRRGRALAHSEMKLTLERDSILVFFAQALSVNTVALRVQQVRVLEIRT